MRSASAHTAMMWGSPPLLCMYGFACFAHFLYLMLLLSWPDFMLPHMQLLQVEALKAKSHSVISKGPAKPRLNAAGAAAANAALRPAARTVAAAAQSPAGPEEAQRVPACGAIPAAAAGVPARSAATSSPIEVEANGNGHI